MRSHRENPSTADRNDSEDLPRLLVTLHGELLQEFDVKEPKTLIGRARLNDIVMRNEYVSKYHAVVILKDNTLILVDLKSANGVQVNSHRVRSTVLRHNDVIQIGNHRIKVSHRSSRAGIADVEPDPADTSIMKTVADVRRLIADRVLRIASARRHHSR